MHVLGLMQQRRNRSPLPWGLMSSGLVLSLGCTPTGDTPELLEDEVEPPAVLDNDQLTPSVDLMGDRRCMPDVHPSALAPVHDESEPGPGSLRFRDTAGKWLELPLKSTSFDTIVTGTVAETEIVQVFGNPLDEPIEATYLFPLHERAAVDDYALTIGARTIRGQIKTREQARDAYERAKQAGQTAALLEQQRPNVFTQSVANIAPGETIEVSLHVVQPLDQDDGRYTLALPTVVGPRFSPPDRPTPELAAPLVPEGFTTCAEIDVSVLIDAGMRPRALRSKHHEVEIQRMDELASVSLSGATSVPADRDFELSWVLEGERAAASIVAQPEGDGGYFTLTIAPPEVVLEDEAIARELIFVVDTSGSMMGKPLDTAKAAIHESLRHMRPDDAFAILGFDDAASSLSPTLLPAGPIPLARARDFVDAMQGDGGTAMNAGISAALAFPHDPERVRMVFFLTDGYIGNEVDIFAQVEQSIGDARLFSLGVGEAPNRYLLDGLAAAGRGVASYASLHDDIAPAVERFHARIATPVLTDLDIDWGGLEVDAVLPARLPDLFAGQPLTVYGRYEGEPSGPIVLRANTRGGIVEVPVEFDIAHAQQSEGIASMWARQEVDHLLGYPTPLLPGSAGYDAAKADVIALALEHRLLTQFTSFVAIDARAVLGADGKPTVIEVPLELPRGSAYAGFYEMGGLVGYGRGGGMGYGTIGLGGSGIIGRGGGGGGYGSGAGAGFGGRGTAVPQVRQGKAEVSGSLDKNIIRRIVRAHVNEVRSCYNAGLAKDPALAGKLVVRFELGADGKVTHVEIADDQLSDAAVGACVAKAVERWTFPKSEGGIVVSYPFEFAP